MLSLVKRAIKFCLKDTRWALERENGFLCFSQEGEDMLLYRLFNGKRFGVFVDIGAHHPIRFSNTYMFYKSGWRGVNIDARPGVKELFDKYRPEDYNVEAAVWHQEGVVKYHMFNEPAFNHLGEEPSKPTSDKYYHIESCEVRALPLMRILEESNILGSSIDFLTIDVEGAELPILSSVNWEIFCPRYVVIEATLEGEGGKKSEVVKLLEEAEYRVCCVLPHSLVFERRGE